MPENYLPNKTGKDCIEEVVIVKEKKALIPAKIQQKKCKALKDTGASRSCMSEKNYHELQLPPLSNLFAVKVTSATGTPIKVLGVIKCPVTLCNSMPFSAVWAYYGKVLVLINVASLNGCVHGEVK